MSKLVNIISYLFLYACMCSCQTQTESTKEYPRMIGDIAFDEELDNPEFSLCNYDKDAIQYYAFTSAVGEKPHLNEKYELANIFNDLYSSQNVKKETGLIRIRFIVNCEGEAGRYRIMGMDSKYQEKEFDKAITDQLLSITKEHAKWKPFQTESIQRDYYMYLIFKIEKGEIIELLP